MKSKDSSHISRQTSRRQFAKAVATTLMTAPLAASLVKAQNTSKPKEATAPPNPQQTPAPQQKPSPLAEAYAEVAHTRFGDQMTPEQFEKVKRDLENNVRTADRLRAVKLKNGDEPDFIFSA